MRLSDSYDEQDCLGSDDPEFEEFMASSRREYEAQHETQLASQSQSYSHSRSSQIASGSGSSRATSTTLNGQSSSNAEASYTRMTELQQNISQLEAEISGLDKEIATIQHAKGFLVERLQVVKGELNGIKYGLNGNGKGKGKGREGGGGINYDVDTFVWMGGLKTKMKEVFGIPSFRLCQRGVCNANMDGRDIVCVMPTGGGKSLTYQLPALMTSGVTLVISPLISLISDQIAHLREAGVEAVKLTGSTSKSEVDDINARFLALASSRNIPGKKEIKLCYVTPEKIAKSQKFVNLLQKLANSSNLSRIVIDEAHCVSQLGHDFRPDYQKLRVLRQLFPRVPIMALSATCPPRVLEDLLKILGLKAVTPGQEASGDGTVYFSAPLYRKNLHYSIQAKHHESNRVIDDMTAWILKHHPNDSGIVYCLTKKDAEKVAQGLRDRGKIKTGVYHADRSDSEKETLHEQWRRGNVKVVCATIAFGLGIDKGDVRFVLHHSISKSLDGFYQESGRAGRDGNDSDCVLFYRPQDAATLSSMTYAEKDGQAKLHGMLSFAQDLQECRKLQFAKYFSHSSQLSISSWQTEESGALERCGHCDNCTRSPDEIESRDVTLAVWQILQIIQHVKQEGGDLTLGMLAGLARGTGGGEFSANSGGGRKRKATKEKQVLDLEALCGGKVELKKDEIEYLLVELLLQKYLGEHPHATAYNVVMYMTLGPLAVRFTRASKADVEGGRGHRIQVTFRKAAKKSGKEKGKEKAPKASGSRKRPVSTKGSNHQSQSQGDDEDNVEEDEEQRLPLFDSDIDNVDSQVEDGDEEDEDADWSTSYRSKPATLHQPRQASTRKRQKLSTTTTDVIEISDSD